VRAMLVGKLHFALFCCIVIVLQVLVGTPENPWLFAFFREVFESYPGGARGACALLICLDLLALLTLHLHASSGASAPSAVQRRPSLRTRTLLWFHAKVWALKGSRVRGFKRRHASLDSVDVPVAPVHAKTAALLERQESTSTTGSWIPGSPASTWSSMSRQVSPGDL